MATARHTSRATETPVTDATEIPRANNALRPPWLPRTPGALHRHPRDGWRMAKPQWWPEVTRRAFRGLVRALCPRPPAPGGPAIALRIEDEVRRAMRYMPAPFAAGLLVTIHILDLSPIWFGRRFRRLGSLEPTEASALLDDLAETQVGSQLVFAARMTVLSMYFDLDEVHEAIGYAPVPFMRDRVRQRHDLVEARGGGAEQPDAHIPDIGPYSETTREAAPGLAAPNIRHDEAQT